MPPKIEPLASRVQVQTAQLPKRPRVDFIRFDRVFVLHLSGDRCKLSTTPDPSELFGLDESRYGPSYSDHLLQQYKLCVEMADHVSVRRALANTFFLTTSTLFVSFIGLLIARAFAEPSFNDILTGIAVTTGSIAFSIAWWLALKSCLT
jgi:hypothetical protein